MLHRSRQRLLTSLGAGAEERCGGGSELAETEREMELTAGPESVRVSVPELPYLLVPELDRVSCLNLGSGTSIRLRQLSLSLATHSVASPGSRHHHYLRQ